MRRTNLELVEMLQEQEAKLRYLAEKEDKPGLSPILLDVALKLFSVAHSLKDMEEEDGKTD
ncbi:hypothetical protein [Sulfurimonas sp. NWX79]